MKEKTFISIVVYVHNAENSIVDFLTRIDKYFSDEFESYEIITVNDASTDNTLKLLTESKMKFSCPLTVITTAWKHGSELAVLAGTEMAIGDFVYEIESTNLEYPIETFREAYRKSGEGFDIVFASPQGKLNLSSRVFYKILNNVSYQKLSLKTESFKLITRRALNAILKSKEKNRYRKILYRNAGFANTTISFKPEKRIDSNRSIREKIELAVEVLLSFSSIGLKLALFLSFTFFFISVGIGIYTVAVYLTNKSVALGWTTTMLFLSVSFSGIFLILSLLGKYLTMVLTESKDKPAYIIQSVKRVK